MENFTKDIIAIMQYLLPGFLAAWVFNGLIRYPKPPQFERIIQALIFTLIIQISVVIEKSILIFIGKYFYLSSWTNFSELLFSTLSALFLGVSFSIFANNDVHKFARKIGITRETSYPSEWYKTFFNNITYVVLHFHDGRRLYGWPSDWPSDYEMGHFVLSDASWLFEAENSTEQIPLEGVELIMVNVKDIRWVEFMKNPMENNYGKEMH